MNGVWESSLLHATSQDCALLAEGARGRDDARLLLAPLPRPVPFFRFVRGVPFEGMPLSLVVAPLPHRCCGLRIQWCTGASPLRPRTASHMPLTTEATP